MQDTWAVLGKKCHLALQVPKEQLCKLLVHALPAGTAAEDVAALLPAAAPRPLNTEGDCSTGGKALLVFASAADANQAFKLLQVRLARAAAIQRCSMCSTACEQASARKAAWTDLCRLFLRT
jgi:hypothetical protein